MIFRGAPNPTITELDIRFCDFARKELERADLTEERREDLREALATLAKNTGPIWTTCASRTCFFSSPSSRLRAFRKPPISASAGESAPKLKPRA
jgi:hypothetical protein